MDKIAILIPCYNEETTIGKVIDEFKEGLPDSVIYVYDNNSTDNTVETALSHGAIVRHEYKQGKGNVIRRMFREIDALAYVMVDGDDTYPADAAPELVRPILEKHADMVVGDRLSGTYYTENKRPFHNMGNSLVCWTINNLFNSDVKDIMTGYRAFSYEFVKTFPIMSHGFEIETEMTIHSVDHNLQLDNYVIKYRNRPIGSESKLNTFSDGIKVITTIIKLYKNYKPLGFFGLLSLICAALSVGFFIPVLMEYLNTGLVEKFPTLIVCGIVLVISLLLFTTGLILSALRAKERREFEFKLNTADFFKKYID